MIDRLALLEALEEPLATEPWLLEGREQDDLLMPVHPWNRAALLDLAEGLVAVTALRQDPSRAVATGRDPFTQEEIEAEIREVRRAARRRKTPA